MTDFFARPTFVIEQHRKFFEMRNQYRIFDEAGAQIGAVEQVKQSVLALLTRFWTDLDAAIPTILDVTDASGQTVLEMRKPWFNWTFAVTGPGGVELGSIAKRIRMGKARFTITDSSGSEMGEVRAENWRAKDFTIFDVGGNEIAQATKKWRGLATEMFTDADTYVVNVQPYASGPMRSMALAAALAIDIVMKDKD